ncbi:hypothetical protein WN943_013079 [Citrus x changshan-huyou]
MVPLVSNHFQPAIHLPLFPTKVSRNFEQTTRKWNIRWRKRKNRKLRGHSSKKLPRFALLWKIEATKCCTSHPEVIAPNQNKTTFCTQKLFHSLIILISPNLSLSLSLSLSPHFRFVSLELSNFACSFSSHFTCW